MARTHEQNLNTTLGILLRRQGLRAGAERALKGKGGGRADCRIRFGSHIIIIEAKAGQSERQQQNAVDNCLNRIDNGHCHAAIAVCYPADADEDTLEEARLRYAILDQDNRAPQWAEGTPGDLASAVALAPAQLGNADLAAARLSDEIGKAIELLSFNQKESLARCLDLPATPEPRRNKYRSAGEYNRAVSRWQTARYDTAAVRGALVIASAVMFHARLDGHLTAADRPVEDARAADGSAYIGEWPPMRADQCLRVGSIGGGGEGGNRAGGGSGGGGDSRGVGSNGGGDSRSGSRSGGGGVVDRGNSGGGGGRSVGGGGGGNVIQALAEAWGAILALDYKPVFQTAIAGILGPNPDENWRRAVGIIGEEALNLTGNLAGGRHDVMGRIFHRVLDTAPYDGSFYTGTAGATLLATLAIRPGDREWTDNEAIGSMVIIDPACGTGTLPIAAATRIRELAGAGEAGIGGAGGVAGGGGAAGGGVGDELAAVLVERALHLYDINLTATHMAATTMGLMSPSTRFRNMNVHRTLLRPPTYDAEGRESDHARLGSLEWLDNRPLMVPWPDPSIGQHADTLGEAPPLPPADLFIMNPPFARDSLRYDQFTEAEEELIKARESALLAATPAHRSNAAGGFVVLGVSNTSEKKGRVATVLPLVGAQNASGLGIRRHIGNEMHVEYVIALKDPEAMAFSENTDIGEMMVIARHWQADEDREQAETVFVKVLRKPQTPAQARALGVSILRGEPHPDYDVTRWPQARMQEGDWFPTQFVRDECVAAFDNLSRGNWFPSANNVYVGQLGPAGQGIRGAFVKSDVSTPYHALWHHKTEVQTTMASAADTYIWPQKGQERLAARYWAQRRSVMLPNRLSVPNTRVTAVYCAIPTVGSAFVPYRPAAGAHDETAVDKAVVAYLNSSVGIVAMLGVTSNKKIVYPNWSVDDHRQIPMPYWERLAGGAVNALAAAYDGLCQLELGELRSLPSDEARRRLDDAVGAALGIPAGEMARTRAALASEPAVTGRTYTGRPAGE